MKANKTLVLGTVLTAAGIGAAMGGSEAHADSIYTVQQGDTVYKISRKFAGDHSLVKAIIKENNLKDPDKIYVGETLEIPTKEEAAKVTTSQVKATPVAQKAQTTQNTYVAPKTQQTVKTTYTAPKANYTKQVATQKVSQQPVAQKTQTAQKSTYVAPQTQQAVVKKSTYTAPKTQQVAYQAPKAQATKQTTQNTYVAPKTNKQPVAKKSTTSYTSSVSGSEASAKSWIAMKESTNNYSARNGRYIGKYQLDSSYLNGDYSAANQERVADKYVKERYGSWSAAKSFHQANGWY